MLLAKKKNKKNQACLHPTEDREGTGAGPQAAASINSHSGAVIHCVIFSILLYQYPFSLMHSPNFESC